MRTWSLWVSLAALMDWVDNGLFVRKNAFDRRGPSACYSIQEGFVESGLVQRCRIRDSALLLFCVPIEFTTRNIWHVNL